METEKLRSEMQEAILFAQENNSDELFLSQMNLSELDESIAGLSSIKSIYLFGNDFDVFPETLSNLPQLERIYLSGNKISELPESIGNLVNLKLLDIKNNHISNLPESFGKLTNLETLYLGNNKFETLPEAITACKGLTKLDVKGNEIDRLPNSIGNLTGLKQFDISDNKLKTFPSSVANLTELKKLHAVNNEISSLPQSFSSLLNLNSNEQKYEWERGLRLDGNKLQLAKVDFDLEPIAIIQKVLQGNTLEEIVEEVVPEVKVSVPKVQTVVEEVRQVEAKAAVITDHDIVISVFGVSEYGALELLEEVFEFSEDKSKVYYKIEGKSYTFSLQNFGFLPLKEAGSKLLKMPDNINLIVVPDVESLRKLKKVNSKSRTIALVGGKVPERHVFEFPVVAINNSVKCSRIIADYLSLMINKIKSKSLPAELGALLDGIKEEQSFYISEQKFEALSEEVGLGNKLEKSYAKNYFLKKGYLFQTKNSLLLSDKLIVDKDLFYNELYNVFNSVYLAKHQGVIKPHQFTKVVGSAYTDKVHVVLLDLMQAVRWCKKNQQGQLVFPIFKKGLKEAKSIEEDTQIEKLGASVATQTPKEIEVDKEQQSITIDATPVLRKIAMALGVLGLVILSLLLYNLYLDKVNKVNQEVVVPEKIEQPTAVKEQVENLDAPAVVIQQQPQGYYMVVATYVSALNAKRREQELIGQGSDAYIFQINDSMYWVAVLLSTDEGDAQAKFDVQARSNDDYWLLKNEN